MIMVMTHYGCIYCKFFEKELEINYCNFHSFRRIIKNKKNPCKEFKFADWWGKEN